jgi:hypothetical protein
MIDSYDTYLVLISDMNDQSQSRNELSKRISPVNGTIEHQNQSRSGWSITPGDQQNEDHKAILKSVVAGQQSNPSHN